ncbi:polygalacturonase [Stylonychia lemnae]|uniref:Polygalacturonase n=1 Tax=Stylonychia lemnae TaxID=5949 RepID=A0A078AVA9_STYLE|nr:polygalacturonase [Stylonychia lemnae]|eukprot:CDW86325.1 polygalacturonase [Stylonychia lemnae]
MRRILLPLISLLGIASYVDARHNIIDHGAIHNQSDTATAFKNAQAFLDAVIAANSSETDREVYIPKEKGQFFTLMPTQLNNLKNITFTIDGYVYLSDDNKNWPNDGKTVLDFIHINDSEDIHIRGEGTFDGQGYWWWMREYIVANKFSRPQILGMNRVQNCIIEGVRFLNSPRFHMYLQDINNFLIQDLEIRVDVLQQKKLAIKYGKYNFKFGIPTFPLNTDGIDPSGSNILIRNVNITSYDDSIAIKPSHGDRIIAKCSENIRAENITTWMGLGMTIGSVPPNQHHSCVRNVTFKNVDFWFPIKAVYIKSNPGTVGDGVIENILYENLKIFTPVWWNIYIGPQQQKQPDGRGPGCMLYPISKECETQPRITMRNITLRNIHSVGGFLPGIVRCNETNPCTDFTFENVKHDGLISDFKYGFITENIFGKVIDSYPAPSFNQSSTNEDIEKIANYFKKYLHELEAVEE